MISPNRAGPNRVQGLFMDTVVMLNKGWPDRPNLCASLARFILLHVFGVIVPVQCTTTGPKCTPMLGKGPREPSLIVKYQGKPGKPMEKKTAID